MRIKAAVINYKGSEGNAHEMGWFLTSGHDSDTIIIERIEAGDETISAWKRDVENGAHAIITIES